MLQGAAGGRYDNKIRIPGVEAQSAADVLTARFPTQSGKTARIVFHATGGRLDDATHKAALESGRERLASGHNVTNVTDPFSPESAAVSTDGTTGYVDVAYTVDKFTPTQLNDAKAAAAITRAA